MSLLTAIFPVFGSAGSPEFTVHYVVFLMRLTAPNSTKTPQILELMQHGLKLPLGRRPKTFFKSIQHLSPDHRIFLLSHARIVCTTGVPASIRLECPRNNLGIVVTHEIKVTPSSLGNLSIEDSGTLSYIRPGTQDRSGYRWSGKNDKIKIDHTYSNGFVTLSSGEHLVFAMSIRQDKV